MDIAVAEVVLGVGALEALAAIDEEDLLLQFCTFGLVNHEVAGGNAGSVEHVLRQLDDRLDDVGVHQVLADLEFRPLTEEDAVR